MLSATKTFSPISDLEVNDFSCDDHFRHVAFDSSTESWLLDEIFFHREMDVALRPQTAGGGAVRIERQAHGQHRGTERSSPPDPLAPTPQRRPPRRSGVQGRNFRGSAGFPSVTE